MPEDNPERPARDPDALSSEYHKARKQVMFWAGILFIWELVGIDLEKAKESGGNAGAIITAIKSPQAVPWVLLVLVGYFLFKLWIEWNQSHGLRRKTLASRLDYGSAWVVAFLAYALYAFQAISRSQVADVVGRSAKVQSLLSGLALSSVPSVLTWYAPKISKPMRIAAVIAITLMATGTVLFALRGPILWLYFGIGVAIGIGMWAPRLFILRARGQ